MTELNRSRFNNIQVEKSPILSYLIYDAHRVPSDRFFDILQSTSTHATLTRILHGGSEVQETCEERVYAMPYAKAKGRYIQLLGRHTHSLLDLITNDSQVRWPSAGMFQVCGTE